MSETKTLGADFWARVRAKSECEAALDKLAMQTAARIAVTAFDTTGLNMYTAEAIIRAALDAARAVE